MGHLLRWLAAALGGLALYRFLTSRRRRGAEPELAEAPPLGPDPAEELRRKLRESRALVDERDAFEEGETTVDRADPDVIPDERRREVHERGRAAADEMRAARPPES